MLKFLKMCRPVPQYRPHLSLKSRVAKDDIKHFLKKAYMEGYRKRAIESGQTYFAQDEVNGVAEFENFYNNL